MTDPTASRGRGRLGIVVPFSNTNLEPDMMLLRPSGVSLHFMRAGGYDLDAVPDSEQMRGFALASLDAVLEALMAAKPDIVLYGCTSATLSHGPAFDRAFCDQIEAKAGVPAVTAAGALVEALGDLGVTKVGFAAPYTEALNGEAIDFLQESGFSVVAAASVGCDLGNYGQGELTPDEVAALACRADRPEAEALVLSCTDMRAVEAIEPLERALGKPVVTSNQALMKAAVKRLGL
ncbi:MAG: aspartate/glutamate racemase family protein [Pseudomonadota bacterium]